MARRAGRQQEMAVCTALGASRFRRLQGAILETFILSGSVHENHFGATIMGD
jgi:hypothetical protein